MPPSMLPDVDRSWRPLSLAPGATINALGSLVVPLAMWVLVRALTDAERDRLPAIMLAVIGASTLFGLLQFSGVILNNPLVNDTPGDVAGTFANRNHFALFLAVGCLIAPAWAFAREERVGLYALLAWALVLLFLLVILASGSRAGLGLGSAALLIGLGMSHRRIRKALARYPRWVFPVALASIVGVLMLFLLLSVLADRALSIDRLFAVDVGQDMRGRALPVIGEMLQDAMPLGSGFGSFDPLFRVHEPFEMLKPTYFNHAHNDLFEVMLDSGLAGTLLLLAGLGWWASASVRAWRAGGGREHLLPKVGSAILFLVILASIVDYPARTPIIMAMTVIAGVWLEPNSRAPRSSALPGSRHPL